MMIKPIFASILKNGKGAPLVEYVILMGGIAVLAIYAIFSTGTEVKRTFDTATTAIELTGTPQDPGFPFDLPFDIDDPSVFEEPIDPNDPDSPTIWVPTGAPTFLAAFPENNGSGDGGSGSGTGGGGSISITTNDGQRLLRCAPQEFQWDPPNGTYRVPGVVDARNVSRLPTNYGDPGHMTEIQANRPWTLYQYADGPVPYSAQNPYNVFYWHQTRELPGNTIREPGQDGCISSWTN